MKTQPRRPRIYLDNVPQHIVQRGHNREPYFFGEEDYQAYLYRLGKSKGLGSNYFAVEVIRTCPFYHLCLAPFTTFYHFYHQFYHRSHRPVAGHEQPVAGKPVLSRQRYDTALDAGTRRNISILILPISRG